MNILCTGVCSADPVLSANSDFLFFTAGPGHVLLHATVAVLPRDLESHASEGYHRVPETAELISHVS